MTKTIVCIAAAVLAGIFSGCKKETVPAASAQALPPATVYVAPAIERLLNRTGDRVLGEVEAIDRVELEARVRGFLVEQNFQEGSLVKKGTVLFRIEDSEYLAKLQEAEAAKQKAQAFLQQATVDFNRQKELLAKKAVSEREYDNAVAAKMTAEAEVSSAEAAISLARLNVDYTTIPAPFDGMMGYRQYSVGSLVGPTSNSLATIVSLNPIYVMFNANESAFLELLELPDEQLPALEVHIAFLNGKTYPLAGKMQAINNEISSSTGTVKLRAVFDNPNLILRPGMNVRVTVQTKEGLPAVLVPRIALASDIEGDYVFVVNAAKKVERRNVKLGANEGAYVIVLDGVKPGESVITSGMQKSRIGVEVNPLPSPNFADSQKPGAALLTAPAAEAEVAA